MELWTWGPSSVCVDGVATCIVTTLWDLFGIATQAFQGGVRWVRWLWAQIEPHLPWMGPLFGIAMAAWRWWDKRESVIWRRVMRLVADEGKYVQDSCQHSLAAILYPSPATPAQRPLFAVSSLREIFALRWWHPLERTRVAKWGNDFLKRTHGQLDEKESAIALYRSFAVAQRYSAFVLQGALAAAHAHNGQDTQGRNRLNQRALDRFDDALRLDGRGSDAVVLELKSLQLRKLGHIQDAVNELNRLQVLVEGRLQAVTPLPQSERQALLVQLLRVVRYQSEMDHEGNPRGTAANARLLGLSQNPAVNGIFREHLEFQNLLERAQYHEVHACVRVRLTGAVDAAGIWSLPTNGVAQQSLHAARSDYTALADQVDPRRCSWPIRLWRWMNGSDSKDGSLRLRVAANEGLDRLKEIEAGKGCQFCRSQVVWSGSAPLTIPTGSV